MAQLSDDCFAFGGPMMSVDEAVGIIAARVNAVRDVETVRLSEADGRILARELAAPLGVAGREGNLAGSHPIHGSERCG